MSLTDTPNGRLVTLSAQRCNTLLLRKRMQVEAPKAQSLNDPSCLKGVDKFRFER
jgi:hypothetical protein